MCWHTDGGDRDDILVHDDTLEDAEFVVESPAANRVECISPVEVRALNTSAVTIIWRTGRGEVTRCKRVTVP